MSFEVIRVNPYSNIELQTPKGVLVSDEEATSSRVVFLFPEFVIKFEHRKQNENELHFYENILQEKDAKFFPKLIGSGYHDGQLFLIQERVFPIENKWASRKQWLQYCYLVDKYSLCDLQLAQRKNNGYEGKSWKSNFNLGITNKGLKIYDIGIMEGMSNPYSEVYHSYFCDCSECVQDYNPLDEEKIFDSVPDFWV